MAEKETFRNRQENEFEVIQSIFGNDVKDLRSKEGKWKPLDILLRLTPQKGSARETFVKTSLHITCPQKYPKYPPKIELENNVGLSNSLVKSLAEILMKKADELKGEVMIYELATTVQTFLHEHNSPPKGSFYDEMMLNKEKKYQDQLSTIKEEEDLKRQAIMDELHKRKKELEKAGRVRRESKQSVSESPMHQSTNSSENSEGHNYKSNLFFDECIEHRNSETLYFNQGGRKILRGSCLGHSQKGCIAYSGIDIETGQLVYLTEWNIDDENLDSKMSFDDVISSIEKQVTNLSNLKHKNLISYECVLFVKRKDGIDVFLVQDFILGTSVFHISGSLGWCAEGASMVAKGILEALVFLHNNGVSHDNLYDSTVFMDNAGNIRVADFSLIPNLQEFSGGQKSIKSDLPALGALIESLSPTPHSEMRDFIEKCKSERTLSASSLLDHPFLRPILFNHLPNIRESMQTQALEKASHRTPAFNSTHSAEHSRLHTEFEVLTYLGKGAFGDVLKVRNILDNREYAIKKIPLPARSKQFYKKMTREVELLSRLNHENVVRYYNSWIETAIHADEDNDHFISDWSTSHGSKKHSNQIARVVPNKETNSDWIIDCMPIDSSSDSSSDGIEFVDSNGEVVTYESYQDSIDNRKPTPVTPKELLYMYIQMEFCEKSTLRTAIDSGLYLDVDRVWRLFREIAEGLSHIHQQGMIHRDLKPVNIFLDSRDQVKIGDFGLATTSILALQNHEPHIQITPSDIANSLTGKVGTALYVAPELAGNASKATYNQKVDLYSLGIILFEMSTPPASTGMERVKTIVDLRSTTIKFPDYMTTDSKYTQQMQVIQWLLNHDPRIRPTSEELLGSELVPPSRLEAGEMQDIIRHVLSNPQSRHYKHLIAKCFAQQSDMICELTYHLGMVPILPIFEFVKAKVVKLFRKHGAIEVVTPLLTPFTKQTLQNNPVKLMTHSGSVVTLPYDLRLPFLRHVALNGVNFLRRYSIGRVYREKKVFNFHPKQIYECAFDIITPSRGNLIIDAELLLIANEIMKDLNILQQKNVFFRINHISLLRSILIYCNVPVDKYSDIFAIVSDYMDDKISKFQFTSSINLLMQNVKTNNVLIDLLQIDTPFSNINATSLRTLLKGSGEAAALANGAKRELEAVISLAQSMGVACPIHLCAGLPQNYERAKSGGIVWQMIGELKPKRQNCLTTIAVGGRYDAMLSEFQKSGHNSGLSIPKCEMSGAGFSFSLDKLVHALGSSVDCEPIEVIICIAGSRPPLQDVIQILRSLWAVGIRTGMIETTNPEEDLSKDIGAKHIIMLGEGGVLRVRSWNQDRFQEKHVTRPELIDYIQKCLRPENSANEITMLQNTATAHTTLKNNSNQSVVSASSPPLDLIYMVPEKVNTNKKRRFENQVEQKLSGILPKFSTKEKITIIMVDLPSSPLRGLVGIIDPSEIFNNETSQNSIELNNLIERYPKFKLKISEVYNEIIDILSEKQKNTPIVGIYSMIDSFCRLIL